MSGPQETDGYPQPVSGSFPPSGAAGGDLAGTYPNPTIALLAVTNAKMAAGAAVANIGAAGLPIADLADPTTGKVIGSAANAAAAVFPPGYQIALVQVATGDVAVTGTNAGTSQIVVADSLRAFDGTACKFTFSTPYVDVAANAAGNAVSVYLSDNGTTILGYFGIPAVGIASDDTQFHMEQSVWLTPSAGNHTYQVRAFRSSANSSVSAAAARPATLEITKA